MHLYYNAACSKSRAALALIQAAGYRPTVIDYLDNPPDASALAYLLDALDVEPAALVRHDDSSATTEPVADNRPTRAQVIAVLTAEPARMQRPVLVVGSRALIARPPERVFELIARRE